MDFSTIKAFSKEQYEAHGLWRCTGGAEGERLVLEPGADLADANLAGAYLARANLAGADLARANLAGADLARAYLAGAYLARANLAGADLAGAYLADAYLAGAYLADANLAGAYLARANLAGADLAGADLAGAYLARANLAGADLAGAYLAGAYLAGAYLARANLAGAYLADAYLAGAKNAPSSVASGSPQEPLSVPIVPDLERKILAGIDAGSLILDMSQWHTCETTHCMAGSAVHLAGEAGYALEAKVGPRMAGALIFRASTPDGHAPHFFARNDKALADLRKRVAESEAAK